MKKYYVSLGLKEGAFTGAEGSEVELFWGGFEFNPYH
jgi:hypothetical protein